jgi:molybdopterin-containing oxidoreductase family iron-sulfur binding subunit
MENTNKRFWRGIEELRNDESFVKNANLEFAENGPDGKGYETIVDGTGTDRRDFLKVLGFGMAAVSLAACDAPVKKAMPYVNKPEGEYPTIANWYASSFTEGGEYASILVKTREGRPIKIEPNTSSSVSSGVSSKVNASLLNLYDIEKLKGPSIEGDTKVEWSALDKDVTAKLEAVAAKGQTIQIVSTTILSPSTKAVIKAFSSKYPTTSWVTYDPNSSYAIVKANEESIGKAIIPSLDFSKAKVIVGIDADFLGTWLMPDTFAKQYSETRKVSSAKGGNKEMSRHYQFETILSLTGSNADYRTPVQASQIGLVATALYNKIASKLGASTVSAPALDIPNLDSAAADLIAAKGASLVVSGSKDKAVQVVVNAINSLLGNYGTTIDTGSALLVKQGNDTAADEAFGNIIKGNVGAVIFLNANPVYDHARGAELAEALPKVGLSISFADRADETASLVKYIAPAPHYLETWNDAEPKEGFYSLVQPTISNIYNTRQAQSSLLIWAGLDADYHEFIRSYWKSNLYRPTAGGFEQFWMKSLHDGVYEPNKGAAFVGAQFSGSVDTAASAIAKNYKAQPAGIELALYETVAIGSGALANNPWLQESPDPITKACWDNYACISQKTAGELGVAQGDVIKVDANGKAVELPVVIQPGLANNTVAIAIGYGREKAGKSANGVGVNVYPFVTSKDGFTSFAAGEVSVSKTGAHRDIAQTQTHDTVMNRRSVLQDTTLAEYQKDSMAGRYVMKIHTSNGEVEATDLSLWNGHEYKNHSWGMVVDLNLCYGCGSCVVGCNAENNIPVVGRQEVINRREMHWLRIDRYYSSDADASDFRGLEIASENPEVTFQPLMCQHCNNAPCETVCPVLATTHSSEGLNQMAYNRCFGTRYCANNCPYKVRRFNWFKYFDNDNYDYNFNNELGKMVINPEVTVRSRGVIEKCSMCVHKIQEGKLTAKLERRRVKDGDIVTACASACSTGAITFGDMNDPESRISKILADEAEGRAYHMLAEINVKPQISYLTKIRNKKAVEA